jgi:hypothetical protein
MNKIKSVYSKDVGDCEILGRFTLGGDKASNVTKSFIKVLEGNGLHRIRFHGLRLPCASMLVTSGVPMKIIQE